MATSCFPSAVGVPGNSTPPDWLSGTAAPFDGSPDDPRWVGSFTHSFGDGAGVQVFFRGLRNPGNTNLLLSWIVKVDPLVTAGQDSLFVGFGSATAAVMVRIALATATATTFGTVAGGAYTPTVQLYSGGSWSGIAAPVWIENGTRVWIDYGTPNPTPWAVEMVVPIGVFLDPGTNTVRIQPNTDFKMWYSAVLNTPAEGGAIIQYPWPGTVGLSGATFPAPSSFADARVSSILNDPACTQTGITLGVIDIGTKDVNGTPRADSSAIRFDQNGVDATAPNHSNQFFAHPNFPPGTLDSRKQQVRARFRLANWGSQIGTLTSSSWKNIPGGDDVSCDTAQNGGECHFIWPTQTEINSDAATQNLLNLFRNGTTTRDQCMLVELSSVFNGEVFLNNSIRRNMDLVGASKFSREAEISIVGLQPIAAVPRDVYLYLETVNMPAQTTPDFENRRKEGLAVLNPTRFSANEFVQRSRPDVEELIKYLPTYRIHTYHDTGLRTTLLGGGSRRILSPQSSFGYFVHHDGNLVGWAARLNGAIRIAEDFYLLRIENNSTAKVTTLIQGVEPGEVVLPEDPIVKEPPPPKEKGGCLVAILKLFKR